MRRASKAVSSTPKLERLFNRTVGTWHTEPVDMHLKESDCKPYYAKSYPAPHSQEQKLKKEVDRLCEIGILRKINHSEWAYPMFTISQPDSYLRSLADLRELNKKIK